MEAPALLARLMDASIRKGARAAEALLVESASLSFAWRLGQVSPPSEVTGSRITGRVYLAGGASAPFEVDQSGAFDAAILLDRAEASLDDALARARETPPDPLAGPADKADLDTRGRALEDHRRRTLTMADRIEVVEGNAHGCQEVHPALVVESVQYEEALVQRSFASTRGSAASERSTRYHARTTARMGPDGRPHHREISTRQFANLAAVPFGHELGRRLGILYQPARPFGTEVPILMRPSCTAHLMAALAPAFAAPAVLEGRSFVAGLIGQRLATSLLHVIDDPGIPGALESRSFDDRGVPPSPVVILKEGVAAGLFVDPRTARAEGLRPTGHSVGGEVRPSNLVVRPGSRTRNAIGMDLRQYVVLDNFHLPDPVDIATGRVETPCDVLVYRNHQAEGGLLGVPLSIPVRDMLGRIVEIAADHGRYGAVDACTLVLRGLVLDV